MAPRTERVRGAYRVVKTLYIAHAYSLYAISHMHTFHAPYRIIMHMFHIMCHIAHEYLSCDIHAFTLDMSQGLGDLFSG